jgi:phosphoribosylaminoimidazole-succinocarboxamide synthase
MAAFEPVLLYEGKAKKVWSTASPDEVVMEFKDDATAFNGQKRGQIVGKGAVNARVSAELFRHLETAGIPTHFLRQLDERRLLVRRLTMIPLEVIARNIVAGSLAQRTGLAEGTILDRPVVEIYYKNDALGDPLFNDDHVLLMKAATAETLAALKDRARRINDVLRAFFLERDLLLVDFKLEFGLFDGRLLLGDEITPDTCRLWDRTTHEKLDKDRFRRDLGGVEDAYREVLRRVTAS